MRLALSAAQRACNECPGEPLVVATKSRPEAPARSYHSAMRVETSGGVPNATMSAGCRVACRRLEWPEVISGGLRLAATAIRLVTFSGCFLFTRASIAVSTTPPQELCNNTTR
jgi:hypothetical protein